MSLMALFTSDPAVIDNGCVFLRLVAFAQIPLALSFVYAPTFTLIVGKLSSP